MKLPPIAVFHLQSREMIAVIGDFDEFGSSNLLLYSYDGVLQHTITAPDRGQTSQFGGVTENNGEIYGIVGFQTDTGWKEEAGLLNLDDGVVTNLHRNY
jgi:hypothetical protein